MDQIMQACHWKVHNSFTILSKNLTWSDIDNSIYLGPLVAAQVPRLPLQDIR